MCANNSVGLFTVAKSNVYIDMRWLSIRQANVLLSSGYTLRSVDL